MCAAAAGMLSGTAACSGSGAAEGELQEAAPLSHDEIIAVLSLPDTVEAHNPWTARLDSMPDSCVAMRGRRFSRRELAELFNDSNYVQLEAAAAIGVQPVADIAGAWRAGSNLRRIATCRNYYIDRLTHSVPYLVPRAQRLLNDIGREFRDSLRARGGGDYRVKVTSVMRTPGLVRRLRRRNRNAVDTSAHLFGTTFDISYQNFICDREGGVYRSQEQLKNLLAEILVNMRERGRCFVKYEHKQACFHITAR